MVLENFASKKKFIYEGEFVDGLRHGNGTIRDNEGNILLKVCSMKIILVREKFLKDTKK